MSSAAARTLVVLPTYNEADNVMTVVGEILAQPAAVEVVVVDDNSPDGTGDLVLKESEREPRLHLLRREAKLGLGSAYLAGFRFGLERGFQHFVTMDCDGSHDPRALPRLLAGLNHFDMVVGSRYAGGGGITNWPLHRRLLSFLANLYTRVLLRLPIRDCTSGYRCYSRAVLERTGPFEIRASGYSFLEEMVWRVHRCGLRVGEVPIVYAGRMWGSSKIDRAEIYRAIWHVLGTALRPPPMPPGAGPDSPR